MRTEDVEQLEPEAIQDKSLDEVLEEVDWEKLGIEDEAEPSVALKAEPALAAEVEPSPAAKAEPAQPAKWEYPLPSRWGLYQRGLEIEIVWKWFGWLTVLGTAGIVILGWGAFVLFPNWGALLDSEAGLFLLAYVAAGFCLTYYTAAGWLNRTRIVVSHDLITVRHEPVPWPGNRVVDASDVEQLRAEPKVTTYRGKGGIVWGERVTYDVHAVTRDGRSVHLVGGLKALGQAHFIAQQIEKHLGI